MLAAGKIGHLQGQYVMNASEALTHDGSRKDGNVGNQIATMQSNQGALATICLVSAAMQASILLVYA